MRDTEKLSVFVPLRVAPSDALALNEVAKSRNVARSELIRELIRSLNASQRQCEYTSSKVEI